VHFLRGSSEHPRALVNEISRGVAAQHPAARIT
jgi:hypothetical protein